MRVHIFVFILLLFLSCVVVFDDDVENDNDDDVVDDTENIWCRLSMIIVFDIMDGSFPFDNFW